MNMKIQYYKTVNKNKNNRTEFWLLNFDYIDGGDYLADIFCKEYNMHIESRLEGIYFNTIRLKSDDSHYELLWHEDIGNVMYSLNEDGESIDKLERRLCVVIKKLSLLLQELENKIIERED